MATFWVGAAEADSAGPAGVYKLVGPESCATAFAISDDAIITNAHVTQRNCSKTDCSSIQLSDNGQPLFFTEAELADEIIAFDLAVIRLKGANPLPQLKLAEEPTKIGQSLSVVGYSNCGDRTISLGRVKQLNSFQFFTDAQIKHGNSGGPALSDDGRVVGIVTQIADPLTGLISSLTQLGGDSKLIRSDLVRAMIGQSPAKRLSSTASYALKFIKDDLVNAPLLRRVLGDIDLANIIQGAVLDALRSGPPASSLTWTLLEQNDLRNFPIGADDATVQELAVLTFLELKNTAYSKSGDGMVRLQAALPTSDHSELASTARRLSNGYPGLVPTALALLGGALVVLFLWTVASCTFIMYGQTSLTKRLMRAAAALLTPMVLFIAWVVL